MVGSLTFKGMSRSIGNVLKGRMWGLRKGVFFQFWGRLMKVCGFSPCAERGGSFLGGEKSIGNYISEKET